MVPNKFKFRNTSREKRRKGGKLRLQPIETTHLDFLFVVNSSLVLSGVWNFGTLVQVLSIVVLKGKRKRKKRARQPVRTNILFPSLYLKFSKTKIRNRKGERVRESERKMGCCLRCRVTQSGLPLFDPGARSRGRGNRRAPRPPWARLLSAASTEITFARLSHSRSSFPAAASARRL